MHQWLLRRRWRRRWLCLGCSLLSCRCLLGWQWWLRLGLDAHKVRAIHCNAQPLGIHNHPAIAILLQLLLLFLLLGHSSCSCMCCCRSIAAGGLLLACRHGRLGRHLRAHSSILCCLCIRLQLLLHCSRCRGCQLLGGGCRLRLQFSSLRRWLSGCILSNWLLCCRLLIGVCLVLLVLLLRRCLTKRCLLLLLRLRLLLLPLLLLGRCCRCICLLLIRHWRLRGPLCWLVRTLPMLLLLLMPLLMLLLLCILQLLVLLMLLKLWLMTMLLPVVCRQVLLLMLPIIIVCIGCRRWPACQVILACCHLITRQVSWGREGHRWWQRQRPLVLHLSWNRHSWRIWHAAAGIAARLVHAMWRRVGAQP